MRKGFQFVARIPYPVTEPKSLVVASEVATINFLRSHGIPVSKMFGYSAVASNSAGTEYIFMELVQGQNLGDIWFTLSEEDNAGHKACATGVSSIWFTVPSKWKSLLLR
jgi:aminoglycoside phosphotransferase (APT) family kinase protein